MKRIGLAIITIILLIGLTIGCTISDPSQALTDAQQETVFTEFYISLMFISTLETQPSEITYDDDGETMTFNNYTLPTTYDQELEESFFGTPQYIGSGSVFNGTFQYTYTSTSESIDVDMTITDNDIPGGEVAIEMEMRETSDSFTISLWLNGNEVDTQEAENLFNDLMASDEFGEVSNPVSQTVGTTVEYELSNYDVNWVSFSATAGTTYIIETHDVGDDIDTVMILKDSNENNIEENDDGGSGLYSQITFTADSNGTYYIGVIEYDGFSGSYNLSILEQTD